jgi:NADPH:quinone reductase-like Zn-dependent oxidoreductase
VLVGVRATTVTTGDMRVRAWKIPSPVFWLPGRLMMGLMRPRRRVLGTEAAGVVEAVGDGATRFKIGDRVLAVPGMKFGAHAEYVRMREDGIVVALPEELSFAQGASIPFAGTTALYFLRDQGKIKRGQRVLVNGASGAIGTYAVQLARHFGCEVTGVCGTTNLDMVRSLGAEAVDYSTGELDEHLRECASEGGAYDIVLDTVGRLSFARCKGAMKRGGRYLAVVLYLGDLARMIWTPVFGSRVVKGGITPERREDVELLVGLAASGEIVPVIDRSYPLDEIVEAHRYVEGGHKRGSVVIEVQE